MRYLFITLAVMFLVACVPVTDRALPTGDVVYDNETVLWDEEPAVSELPDEPEPEDIYFTIEAVEGDLIELSPEAIDPDGDRVTFAFSDPFTKKGRWQTTIGDEGRHFVSVEASDGKEETVETILVIVHRANRPPIIECQPVTVDEGDNINLHDYCTISDEDNEEVVVTYNGWMTSWRRQTDFEDAGTYTVLITASDKRDNEILHVVTEEVTVTVRDVNRPPVFGNDFPAAISATENDVITLPTELISDPDGDDITVRFSEPFDDDGVWETEIGDAGEYTVDVVATDGEANAKRTVRISLALLNTAPVLKPIRDITVEEGETIKLPISATDREGDPLTVTISGWMTEDTYTTTYDDAGEYTVKVEVSDGEFTASQVVNIVVEDVNRPPVFVTPA